MHKQDLSLLFLNVIIFYLPSRAGQTNSPASCLCASLYRMLTLFFTITKKMFDCWKLKSFPNCPISQTPVKKKYFMHSKSSCSGVQLKITLILIMNIQQPHKCEKTASWHWNVSWKADIKQWLVFNGTFNLKILL